MTSQGDRWDRQEQTVKLSLALYAENENLTDNLTRATDRDYKVIDRAVDRGTVNSPRRS